MTDELPNPGGEYQELTSKGVQPPHPSLSLVPFENIDLVSGNVSLTFTDIDLPGNGLVDLQVVRSFNGKDMQWHVGPGYIQFADRYPDDTTDYSPYPVIVSADGGEHPTGGLVHDDPYPRTVVFQTREFWRYDRRTHRLEMPNGVVIDYLLKDEANGFRYPTDVYDPFGTGPDLHYDYEPTSWGGWRIHTITQYVGADTRVVTFNYQADLLSTIVYGSQTWTYNWNGNDLSSVTLPTGRSWTYFRGVDESGNTGFHVTTPNGGTVSYTFGTQQYACGGTYRGTRVVKKRNSAGTHITPGEWTIDYGSMCYSSQEREVVGPAGTNVGDGKVHIVYTGVSPHTGGYQQRETRLGSKTGPVVETETIGGSIDRWLGWDQPEPVPPPEGPEHRYERSFSPHLVLLTSRTVARDGRSYQTAYDYHPWAVPDDLHPDPNLSTYSDWGQPYRITEYGDRATRITERGFRDFAARYIKGKLEWIRVQSASPFEMSFAYDWATGFLTSKTIYGLTTTYEPDTEGNLRKKIDGEGKWVEWGYRWGVVNQIRAPLYTVDREVSEYGTIERQSRGTTWVEFDYDGLGREIERRPALGLPATTDYGHEGDPSNPYIQVSRGTSWTRKYLDGFGRTIRTENSVGVKTTTRYDAWGRKEFESYPFDTTEIGTTYLYDVLGRVISKTEADGKQTTFSYGSDADGLTTTITEPFRDNESRQTVQTWKALGDPESRVLFKVHDAEQQDTTYQYNEIDKLTEVHSPGIGARTYTYQPGRDLLQQESHPESGTTSYDYWANGKLKTRTDALGETLTYAYDAANRLDSVQSSADPAYNQTIAYDDPRSDNRASVSNARVTTAFSYDNAARLVGRTDTITPAGGTSRTFTTTYVPNGYDSVERVTYPTGRVVTYGFDNEQRITGVADDSRAYASFIGYHPSGQIAGYTGGNGVANAATYDPLTYRPATITAVSGGQTALGLTYHYLGDGNVSGIDETRQGTTAHLTYGYDRVDRLTSHDRDAALHLTYEYDAVGNRRRAVTNSVETLYHYDQTAEGRTNVLTGLTGGSSEALTPNAIGQTQADGRGSYTYTPTGLMKRASLGSGLVVDYTYDADDMRASETKGGVTHYYVHGLGGQLLSEYTQSGGQLFWERDYIYAGSRLLSAVRPSSTTPSLSVTVVGGGSVSSAPAGINCGTSCTSTFPAGTHVSLTAAAPSGWRFAGWSGDPGCSGEINLRASLNCTATFTHAYVLTVTKTGDASAAATVTSQPSGISCGASCTATFDAGTQVTLSAAPPTGFVLSGWSGEGCATGTVLMDRARTCTATFRVQSTKLAPANQATGLQNPVTLTWTPTENAGYWVCWDTTPNNTCDTMWWPHSLTAKEIPETLPPGTYYWQVQVQDGTGARYDTDNGAWWHFTVAPPAIPADHWTAQYYNNTTLTGGPVLVQDEGTGFIDHEWGGGSPPGVQSDNFSARWTRTVYLSAGRYRFTIITDDGSCLYVDGQNVLDYWFDQSPTTYTVDRDLGSGNHTLEYRFYEHGGGATAKLSWAILPPTPRYTLSITKSGDGTVTVAGGIDCGATCAADYDAGTQLTLVQSAAPGWRFTGWSGYADCADGVVTMDASKECNANFVQTHALTVFKDGEGGDGSLVTSSPAGIDFGAFDTASFDSGTWVTLFVQTADGVNFTGWSGEGCNADGTVLMDRARYCTATFELSMPPCDPDGSLEQQCRQDSGEWDPVECACHYWWLDPLVLTLDGGPTRLTRAVDGVMFDANGDGRPDRVAWTRTGAGVAFLVLDLNGNGVIDNVTEMLGQPVSGSRPSRAPNSLENSFRTLAAFDENRDGAIDRSDAVYTRLRLWTDLNHDGVSQPSELVSLSPSGIERIELAYQAVGRRDGQRNYYRYRGTVRLKNGRQVPLWDVFLDMQPGSGSLDSAVDVDPAMAELASTKGWREETSVSMDPSTGVQTGSSTSPLALGPTGGASATTFEQSEAAESDLESMSFSEESAGPSVATPPPPPPPPAGELVEYYHLDALGSVRLVTDETGAVLRHHDYLPFGEEWQPEIGSPDKRLFTGKERDVETGLDYFGARYYRADLGRFTSIDPVQTWAENLLDPQRWNRYAYALNSSLKYTDPDGRTPALLAAAAIPGPQQAVVAVGLGALGAIYVYKERHTIASSLSGAWAALSSTLKEGADAASAWWTVEKDAPGRRLEQPQDPPNVRDFADPNSIPEGWVWKGKGQPGSREGAYNNPSTGESLHNDTTHPAGKVPHWTYTDPDGVRWDNYGNGWVRQKAK